jgi:hypothetical protein
MDGEESKLVVVSDDEIQAVRLQRCSSDKINSCRECVALQDPYCAWDNVEQHCTAVGSPDWSTDKNRFIQSIALGEHEACGHVTTEEVAPAVPSQQTKRIINVRGGIAQRYLSPHIGVLSGGRLVRRATP